VALSDLSAHRAELVGRLNEAAIPVTAWLLLPTREGFYFSAGNAKDADARFGEFEKWTAESPALDGDWAQHDHVSRGTAKKHAGREEVAAFGLGLDDFAAKAA
jgi:hypothetical protein